MVRPGAERAERSGERFPGDTVLDSKAACCLHLTVPGEAIADVDLGESGRSDLEKGFGGGEMCAAGLHGARRPAASGGAFHGLLQRGEDGSLQAGEAILAKGGGCPTALQHTAGCLLPLFSRRPVPPANLPGASAMSVDLDAVLGALGHTLQVFSGSDLVDPSTDPVAIARPETPATEPLRLLVRVLDGVSYRHDGPENFMSFYRCSTNCLTSNFGQIPNLLISAQPSPEVY